MPLRHANLLLLASASLTITGLVAQAPAFDVASVKPNYSGSPGGREPGFRNGTFNAQNVPLKTLLGTAYRVQTSRIKGPDWIDSDRFDLTAKSPTGVPDNQLMPMLQALLKERFQVTVHRETKEMAAYDMVAAKGGVKIRPFDPAHPQRPQFNGGSSLAGNGTMSQIADALARVLGRPILDKTGKEGVLFYSVNYAPLSNRSAPGLPDLFEAVEEQMGVKLESKKEPVEILIVDRAERVPTPN